MADDSPQQDGTVAGGLAAGSRVAAYRVEVQAGAGGMAVVYRARDERLGRTVALKVLAPALAADARFRQRFIRESRAAAAVDDPHIIPVYEAGEAGGVLFIAMRYVSGGDLRSVAAREGPLPADRASGFISAAASALDAAHAAGLVHRDVKPSNMLVDARPGRPDHLYLSDFGLSKGALSSAASLTGSAEVFGTPDYLAPEQANGGKVDGRADQYALGCAAFALLAGAPLFERDHPMAVLLAHLSAPPPALTRLRPDLPDPVDQVLARALAKAPGDRYPSCAQFAAALRDALGLPPYAPALLPDGAGPADQAALPAGEPDLARTHTITLSAKGARQPDTPAGQPGLAAAEQGGHPVTAGITAPGDVGLVGNGQQPARKRWLNTGRHRVAAAAAAAAILLAICLAAVAVTLAGMAGTHKPQAAAGRKPTPARHTSAPPRSTVAPPRSTAPVPVDVFVASCPIPAADYTGMPYRPQAAPTTLRLPGSLNPPGSAQVFGTTFPPDSTSYLVGPKSASCQAVFGADGSETMTATSAPGAPGRVTMVLSPGGLGPSVTEGCPYIAAVRANAEAVSQSWGVLCDHPAADVIQQIPTGTANLYAAAVLVPAGVKDPNIEGDGSDPTVALYTAQVGQDATGQDIECTFAPAQAGLCAVSLKFFLASQAQIRNQVTPANLARMQAAVSSFMAEQNAQYASRSVPLLEGK